MEMISQLGAVGLVLVLLAVLVSVGRRRGWVRVGGPAGGGRARRMVPLERLVLTPQHSLHLVRVDNETLVLSVSPTSCALVCKPSPTPPPVDGCDPVPSAAVGRIRA